VAREQSEGIDAVADELYGLHPGDFVAARDVWVRQARHNGDRVLATRIAALRRPTIGAWMVNLLRREAGEVIEQLVGLGAELRAAQDELAAADLRRLAAERHRLVLALTGQARRLAAAAGHDVDRAALTEVEATLGAALAEEALGTQVLSGRLVGALEHVGFGPEPGGRAAATARRGLRAVRKTPPATARPDQRAERAAAQERIRADRAVAAAHDLLMTARRRVQDTGARRERAHRDVAEHRERLTDAQRRAAEADLDERSAAAELTKAEQGLRDAEAARTLLANRPGPSRGR
jgi:hypothetical protein